MRVTVCKIFRFDSAHFLPNYEGKCRNLHGHSWTLEISVSGGVNPDTGMVIDFVVLKDIVNRLVVDKLDHTLLNDLVTNPTCENLLEWIWNQLVVDKIPFEKIRLWETPDSWAEVS